MSLVSLGWILLWRVAPTGVMSLFGLSPHTPIPSISPYSDVDLPGTLRFVKRPGKPLVKAPLRTLHITAYTDRPDLWTPQRYNAAMAMARWYLRRCQIALPKAPLRVLPRKLLTRDGLLQFRLARDVRKSHHPYETFLFFTKSAVFRWGASPKRYRLLGLSHQVRLPIRQSKPGTRSRHEKRLRLVRSRWLTRPAVWTRLSPVYTTLAHEIGHRLGLRHSRKPYHLMLDGPGVRSSFATLWTSALGYFDPQRFGFSKRQCQVMQRTLAAEQRRRRLPLLRPVPVPRPTPRPQKRRTNVPMATRRSH